MEEKPLAWLGSSLADLRAFPADARRQAGHELYQVQQGLSASDWRPMSAVGAGVVEIRIHKEQEFRVFYVAKFAQAVYVLHAFEKKTRKTPQRDIDLARTRYSELVRLRRHGRN